MPLSGMYNKSGGKVRLTFKLEQDQLWIGTKGDCMFLFYEQIICLILCDNLCEILSTERTEKIPMGSIKNVVAEPIEDHEDYHMMVCNNLFGTYLVRHLIKCIHSPSLLCLCMTFQF